MFITVRFGDGEESIFNPNCRTNILLEDIKRRCNCTKDVTVDLSDESGNLKYLTDNPMSYATEILKERESFVLIRVEKKGETEGDSYTPLLNDVIIVTPEFLARSGFEEPGRNSPRQGYNEYPPPGCCGMHDCEYLPQLVLVGANTICGSVYEWERTTGQGIISERLSRCESDSLNAKNSAARPVRLNSPLTRRQTGMQGKTKASQLLNTSRNKTSREKTPGQKRNRESR